MSRPETLSPGLIVPPPSAEPRSISIFGATGSVGTSTLDLIRLNPSAYRIVALTANSDAAGLAKLAREFSAQVAVIGDPAQHQALAEALEGSATQAWSGPQALLDAADLDADWTMAAIVGCAGLAPIMRSLLRGRSVALANKEALVSSGALMIEAARSSGATLLPVDSEHNAIFQCLAGASYDHVQSITLTASGGPFRTWTIEQMRAAGPAQAVAHPNWSMGAKISVDSATMFNKGLELIEAYHLFPVGLDAIRILVHPQSVIHSMVEYRDRSTLAQLGAPDMRIPIASALAWPDRIATDCAPLDLATIGQLTFEPLDDERFPGPGICRQAIASGGGAPAILNAANEIAVAAFLKEEIGFLDIAAIVSEVLAGYSPQEPQSLQDVLAIDREARVHAAAAVRTRN
ncbi:MAG: 1-deoxy-D-xylulose-5-phosphate reductoisomerase [Sphingomonadales bacterium RIFCSPHIGHO2_01_FULL_65_20]|jgi:1-deoxy-D-xylulose-5-phosphate reductoisomerase|uniref:1-deoxy-D-xylulose-5-phosphate reductoisomerase n=1 Tax=unclassified Blastomonas TaxID=2626550 RepID=UPI000836E957|nr:1-deoxy-D-xylulose-5-phosphate reductoisomerase [Blastomonas sp.]MCH2238421.1 1-deoxy-D-xylulose-5-phosphate reductoisomerase [Blastomonas sp.]OHC96259.1 MAG: 1-deoxy-D-xylulose-5-phosphate reductoisomerase [Sphingomonadales bacterium RIFCSPHIGHO2_01_FULL_65_20]